MNFSAQHDRKMLAILAFFAVSMVEILALHWGVTDLIGDSVSRTVYSKLMTQSLTPGISQIGSWNPLTQYLLSPIVYFDWLYVHNLAPFIINAPFFILAALGLHSIMMQLTQNRAYAFIAAILFIINPYSLYYATTSMSESPFIALVIIFVDRFLAFLRLGKISHFYVAAFVAAVASVARYEGLVLVAGGFFILLLANVLQERKFSERCRAELVIFLFISLVGLFYHVAYGYYYRRELLAFNLSFVHGEIRASRKIPSADELAEFFVFVVSQINGYPYAAFFCACFVGILCLAFLRKLPKIFAMTYLLLGGMAGFVLLAEALGQRPMNPRFFLSSIPFFVLVPTSFLYLIRSLPLPFQPLRTKATSILVAASLLAGGVHALDVIHKRWPYWMPEDPSIRIAGEVLSLQYDYGYVLAILAGSTGAVYESKIPLNKYILETNFGYFQKTISEPWLIARWILFKKSGAINRFLGRVVDTRIFQHFYYPVYTDDHFVIYKIKDRQILKLEQQLDTRLPSVDPSADFYRFFSDRFGIKKNAPLPSASDSQFKFGITQ